MSSPLPPDFYDRPVLDVARALLGCTVTSGPVAGVIVETEAYHESEPSCHAFRGRTESNGDLFGPPGTAYLYRSYGIHTLLNAVCEPEGVGAAVLIRAVTPTAGLELVAERRQGRARGEWTNGPGKLGQAFGLSVAQSGSSLASGPIVIGSAETEVGAIRTGPRIGISQAVELPWRFALPHCTDVSRPRL